MFHIEFLCIGSVGRERIHLIPLRPYSSYMEGFDVITYKVDSKEYMCCVLFILLNFQGAHSPCFFVQFLHIQFRVMSQSILLSSHPPFSTDHRPNSETYLHNTNIGDQNLH